MSDDNQEELFPIDVDTSIVAKYGDRSATLNPKTYEKAARLFFEKGVSRSDICDMLHISAETLKTVILTFLYKQDIRGATTHNVALHKAIASLATERLLDHLMDDDKAKKLTPAMLIQIAKTSADIAGMTAQPTINQAPSEQLANVSATSEAPNYTLLEAEFNKTDATNGS